MQSILGNQGRNMFTFHRIGFRDADGKECSAWNALLETDEQVEAYLRYMAHELAQVWIDIKDSPENKDGHCRTTRANVAKQLLTLKMEKEELKQISVVDGVTFLEQVFTKTAIELYCQDGSVYVNAKGGCRDTEIRNDDRVKEEIFETCINKDFVFPTLGEDVVKITNWPGCPHFYISVNGKNVQVDGVDKWKTIQGAEEAKKKYLRRNRYRGVKE